MVSAVIRRGRLGVLVPGLDEIADCVEEKLNRTARDTLALARRAVHDPGTDAVPIVTPHGDNHHQWFLDIPHTTTVGY
jgi:hypothetical protein